MIRDEIEKKKLIYKRLKNNRKKIKRMRSNFKMKTKWNQMIRKKLETKINLQKIKKNKIDES
jgi:hypothetical protein